MLLLKAAPIHEVIKSIDPIIINILSATFLINFPVTIIDIEKKPNENIYGKPEMDMVT